MARSSARAITVGGASTAVCLLPAFLTGAMAVEIRGDLSFGAAALGLAIGVYRLSGAVTAVPLGRVADRIGAVRSLRVALIAVAVSTVGMCLSVNWASLVCWLALLGTANSLCQPGANRLLINSVKENRLGAAFGAKQSAPPFASALAGFSVPVIALTVGWRGTFLLGAVLALAALVAVGRRSPSSARSPQRRRRGRLSHPFVVVSLAIAFGCCTAVSSSVTTFYVDSAVTSGSTQRAAGTLLALASIAAIVARVVSGIWCDRMRGGHLKLCALLLVVGGLGVGLLAFAGPGATTLGVLVALPGVWGLNGAFWFALVRVYRDTPGAVTGVLSAGARSGGALGPILFGVTVEHLGYRAGWAFAASLALVAAAAMWVGNAMLVRQSGAGASVEIERAPVSGST